MLYPFKNKVNTINIAKIFFFLFILSLFFPIRYVFPTESSLLTGIYSDFTSISLYLSDILLFITFLFIVSRGNYFWKSLKNLKFWIFWLILAIIWQITAGFSALNAFFFIKLLELIVLYGTVSSLAWSVERGAWKKWLFTLFAGLSAIQSVIAIVQFIYQGPIGLNSVGEQIILPQTLGVAKIIVSGETLIRGYGTFPHPNLLSAFFLVGIFSSIWLFLNSTKRWKTAIYSFLLILNIFGITVTFSRAAFLALFIGFFVYFGYLMFNGKQSVKFSSLRKGRVKDSLLWVIISIIASIIIFQPYLLTRVTVSDSASLKRMSYNEIGIQMIQDNPIFGVGAGESVLHMEQYSNNKLWPWQKQPIHNYYLLTAAELGIIGSLILIGIFLSHLFRILNLKILKLFRNYKLEIINLKTSSYRLTLFTILLAFLLLMMFDHYFYTLEQTQMLLWLILGLIAAEKQNFPLTKEKLERFK